jgi:hypothetical protein
MGGATGQGARHVAPRTTPCYRRHHGAMRALICAIGQDARSVAPTDAARTMTQPWASRVIVGGVVQVARYWRMREPCDNWRQRAMRAAAGHHVHCAFGHGDRSMAPSMKSRAHSCQGARSLVRVGRVRGPCRRSGQSTRSKAHADSVRACLYEWTRRVRGVTSGQVARSLAPMGTSRARWRHWGNARVLWHRWAGLAIDGTIGQGTRSLEANSAVRAPAWSRDAPRGANDHRARSTAPMGEARP